MSPGQADLFIYRQVADRDIITGPAPVRRTDPDTSHAAAHRAQEHAAKLEEQVLAQLAHGPGTIREVAAALRLHEWSVSPRFRPLANRGLIADSGQRRGRAIVWRCT